MSDVIKSYSIKMKNGDSIRINHEQNEKLLKLLTMPKAEIPSFINIQDNVIRVDFIASIKADSW